MGGEKLLLVLPLTGFLVGDTIFVDEQACMSLGYWLDHFSAVTLICPTVGQLTAPRFTKPLESARSADRLSYIPLPRAYTPFKFFRSLFASARILHTEIKTSDYLHFAIGGFFGDWASVASLIAIYFKRPFAVWTDRVESEVLLFQNSSRRGWRRLYYFVISRLARRLEEFIIRRSWVGLFHGMDCFNAYCGWSNRPFLVHNLSLQTRHAISEAALNSRLSANDRPRMQFVYAGRVHADKGVCDWIDVFTRLNDLGFDFQAVWYGDGPQLDDAKRILSTRKLDSKVSFAGSIDQLQLIEILKRSDAFVFCHKTKESPRCLIEALKCGLPLVGYRSDYAEDLLQQNSGGMLSTPDGVLELVDALGTLFDRSTLRELSERAFRDGRQFAVEAIFAIRAKLIKTIPNGP
jgi:colanic acid/amylovoran biosynthesis glycosyltransferase